MIRFNYLASLSLLLVLYVSLNHQAHRHTTSWTGFNRAPTWRGTCAGDLNCAHLKSVDLWWHDDLVNQPESAIVRIPVEINCYKPGPGLVVDLVVKFPGGSDEQGSPRINYQQLHERAPLVRLEAWQPEHRSTERISAFYLGVLVPVEDAPLVQSLADRDLLLHHWRGKADEELEFEEYQPPPDWGYSRVRREAERLARSTPLPTVGVDARRR